jgi:hypothetical protein
MSILVLALTLIPCSDTACTTDTAHSHKEDKTDECTPFCICDCCGAQITLTSFNFGTPERQFHTLSEETNQLYISSYIPGFYGHIWQPPKI